jgi:hypothetical protein
MGQTERIAQSRFHDARVEQCPCGRSLHDNRMFDQGVPCPHQIYRGAVIWGWKIEAKLVHEKSEMPLAIHATFFPWVTKLEDDARMEWHQTLAIDHIKHFSKAEQSKRVIRSWVAEN